MEEEINVTKYIGAGYKENARGENNCYDCYTLFLAIQSDLGHDLSVIEYNALDKKSRKKAVETGQKMPCFEKIKKPLAGCAVVMYHNDIAQHIGVYVGNGKIIHATYDRGVVIDEVRTLDIEGFYKVK